MIKDLMADFLEEAKRVNSNFISLYKFRASIAISMGKIHVVQIPTVHIVYRFSVSLKKIDRVTTGTDLSEIYGSICFCFW